jgi:hypothetical protein
LSWPDGLIFLFDGKKKQKPPAQNFSIKVSAQAWKIHPEKFTGRTKSGTKILCFGMTYPKFTTFNKNTRFILG